MSSIKPSRTNVKKLRNEARDVRGDMGLESRARSIRLLQSGKVKGNFI